MKGNQHKSVGGRKEEGDGKTSGKKERRGKGGELDLAERGERMVQPVSVEQQTETPKRITLTPWPTSSSTL